MSEPASSGSTAAGPEPPETHEQRPQLRNHRVVRSEELPRFSIGAPIATGIIIWVALLVTALLMHDQLADDGKGWWVWCAFTGVILGFLGWLYVVFRLKDQPGQVMEPHDPNAPRPPPPGLRD